jgi:hypothetical protein
MELFTGLVLGETFAVGLLTLALLHGGWSFLRSGRISPVANFIYSVLPTQLCRFCSQLFPNRPFEFKPESLLGIGSSFRYSLIFLYSSFYFGCHSLYFLKVFPHLSLFLDNPEFHTLFSILVLPCPLFVVLILQISNPGVITPENVDSYLNVYPYDSLIYHPAKCAKLLIPAVPRSRYCPYTRQRIARYDHYCPWVGQAIGERTLRWFVLFLLANLSAFCYYFVVSAKFLWCQFGKFCPEIEWQGSTFESLLVPVGSVLRGDSIVAGLSIFLFLCSLALFSSFCRQLFCISVNVTTSEIPLFQSSRNFYNRGIFANWFDVLFPPFINSLST